MSIYYSSKNNGFYDSVIHQNQLPDDAVKVNKATYQQLLNEQSLGKKICSNTNGFPIAIGKFEQFVDGNIIFNTGLYIQSCKTNAVLQINNCISANHQAKSFTSTWPEKARRAERVITGRASKADLAILKLEAEKRNKGETAKQLAKLQLQKADAYAMKVALLDGIKADVLQKIESTESAEQLEALTEQFKTDVETELDKLQQQDLVAQSGFLASIGEKLRATLNI